MFPKSGQKILRVAWKFPWIVERSQGYLGCADFVSRESFEGVNPFCLTPREETPYCLALKPLKYQFSSPLAPLISLLKLL
jgi:hypothetical protein